MFNDNFYITQSNSVEDLSALYKLRYMVYCEEFNYESCNSQSIESDIFDDTSIHISLKCKKLKKTIGGVRLILADLYSLPVEKLNKNLNILNRNNTVEVSRLILLKEYRGKVYDFPLLIILFIKVLLVCKELNKFNLFMLIDDRFYKLLKSK